MEHGKLKVVHCEFDTPGIQAIISKPLPLFYYDLNINAGVSPTIENDGKYGVQMTYKYRVYANKTNSSLIGSYITEQWFYITFPNENDIDLMRDIKLICDNSMNFTRDKFNEIKRQYGYPFAEWDYVPMWFREVENILSLLRQVASQ